MNPVLSCDEYIPDVEARTFGDGYIYIYGSKDIPGNDLYCSRQYDVYRSYDLISWEKYSNVFSSTKAHRNNDGLLYAPDCEYINGQYCLFYCMDDGTEGVAFSNKPYGPFDNARPIIGADGGGIDPAVFVDDDGKVYYYWGQRESNGAQLDTKTWSIIPETLVNSLVTEREHGFHEGSSIRKRNGIYYYVFADITRGRPTCLGYATASTPLGKFTKQGIIIDNVLCDPSSWNNHGCIFQFKNKWYVFYHRSTGNSFFGRHACIEQIFFDEMGHIDEVKMTTNGAESTISCKRTLFTSNICALYGNSYLCGYNDGNNKYEYLANLHNSDEFVFSNLTFDTEISCIFIMASLLQDAYTVEVYVDNEENMLVSINVNGAPGNFNYIEYSSYISGKEFTGEHDLKFRIVGEQGVLGNIVYIRFE